jgi:hypothetical protein
MDAEVIIFFPGENKATVGKHSSIERSNSVLLNYVYLVPNLTIELVSLEISGYVR